MHVHSSFSEGGGAISASLESQIGEALNNGFSVMWSTDHDWRMSAYQAPDAFHFASLVEKVQSKTYSWTPAASGGLSSRSGGSVSGPLSPYDTAATKGSLRVEATGSSSTAGSYRYLLNTLQANDCSRTNLTGQTISIDVLPQQVGSKSWGEILLTLSHRPAMNGRPAGKYQLSYRLGIQPATRAVVAKGLLGVVTVPVTPGEWNRLTLDPLSDVAAIWPDIVPGDNSLVQLFLGVSSAANSPGRVFYGNLTFGRAMASGDLPLQVQDQIIGDYAQRYPQLVIRHGAEVSGTSEHSNWFGGGRRLIDYTAGVPSDLLAYGTDQIHAYGGLASLNHPFGSGSSGAPLAQADQDAKRRAVAETLLARRLGGVDLVETGYRQRAGISLETHLALFDTFIRNGFWVTANGVNDNHSGSVGSWAKEANRFFTTTWAASAEEADLLWALRCGRAFVGELGDFNGLLDLSVEGNPMGSVSIRPGLLSRALTVVGVDLPVGSTVEVVRGPVDYSGALDPGTTVVALLPASGFVTGEAVMSIDTSSSCFVRVNVVDKTGRRIAFSNPIMLLIEEPAEPLPSARRAPDSPLPNPGL